MYQVIDIYETNSRHQKRYSKGGKKLRGCRGLLGRVIFEDEHVRSGVVHLVFQSQTLEQLGVFEKVRVVNDLYIFEEHLMHH